MSILVFNGLSNNERENSTKFFNLQLATYGSIPNYMVQIDNIDLSGYEFEGDTPNLSLVNAKLKTCTLSGTFHGTNFSGADLTKCTVKQGSHFMGCNFSGTTLN